MPHEYVGKLRSAFAILCPASRDMDRYNTDLVSLDGISQADITKATGILQKAWDDICV